MRLKLTAALLAFSIPFLAYAGDADIYPCVKINIGHGYYFVCGEVASTRDIKQIDKATSETVRAPYTNQAGQQMVGTFPKYIRHSCKDDICLEVTSNSSDGPFSGHAPNGLYLVQLGYYLSPSSNGEAAAYLNGTGPLFGGTTSQPSNGLTGDACYEQKLAAFHQENGEGAMVTYDQINEWLGQCGLPPEE